MKIVFDNRGGASGSGLFVELREHGTLVIGLSFQGQIIYQQLQPVEARELRDALAQAILPTLAELAAGPLPGARSRSSQLDFPLQLGDPRGDDAEIPRGPLDVALDDSGGAAPWFNPFAAEGET
jgi:hypothetical protein